MVTVNPFAFLGVSGRGIKISCPSFRDGRLSFCGARHFAPPLDPVLASKLSMKLEVDTLLAKDGLLFERSLAL